jgi:Flp pilus assembly protein TadG
MDNSRQFESGKAVRRRASTQKGSAIIEGACVTLVFLAMIFGIMDWSRMMFANNFVSSAARDATRYAMVHGSSSSSPALASDLTTLVKNEAVGLDPTKITVSTTWNPNNSPGSSVTVQVQYSFQGIAPYMPSSMTLKSSSTMLISQ